jgi:hypothetical protein
MTGRGDRDALVAAAVGERVVRAQDMLGRVGSRAVYERNYASEKLVDAVRRVLEACALLGMNPSDLCRLADDAAERGARLRTSLIMGEAGS